MCVYLGRELWFIIDTHRIPPMVGILLTRVEEVAARRVLGGRRGSD
jgi:hypothetical protein